MNIHTLAGGYFQVLREVAQAGVLVAPRGDPTLEILDFHLTVTDSRWTLPVTTGRKPSQRLAKELALQVLGGVYRPERLTFNPGFVDDDALENYGPLLAPGIERSITYLQADPMTRRAVANLGHTGGESGYPCTVSLGWAIRQDRLHAFSTMRSQDAWLGLPYDLYMFAAVQRSMASVLGVEPGPMHHSVRSFHVYRRDVPKISAVGPATDAVPTHEIAAGRWVDVQRLARWQLDQLL